MITKQNGIDIRLLKVVLVSYITIICLTLGTSVYAGAPSAQTFDVFIEAENAMTTSGFEIIGLPRSWSCSGNKFLNLWQLKDPTSSGYYAKYLFQVTSAGKYYIIIWVQALDTPYSSPFKLILDKQEWRFNKETAKPLPNQIRYGEDITGYFVGPIPLERGYHNLSIIVSERRAYSDKAYNLLVDAIALTKRDPLITEKLPKVVLTVDAANVLGSFSPLTDLSQGGISEVNDPAFWRSVAPMLNTIGTSLVRIDHIFDDKYYSVVQRKSDGSYEYDWKRLDAVISEILKTDVRPFLCLSYMPLALSRDSRPNQAPTKLDEWRILCRELVRHMKDRFNLTGLYYEVWNEPDLKEFWRGSQGDYFDLYRASVEALKSIDPSAKVGGPAVSSPATGWLSPFLEFVKSQKLQLDFVSWHLYSQDPVIYSLFIQNVKKILAELGFPGNIEMMLTEWNSSGHLDPANDAFYNAGHTVAVLAALHQGNISKAFFFMPKDYVNSQRLYGGWGLITHDGRPKPSYNCIDAYSRMRDGEQIKVTSTDNSVSALGVIKGTTLRLLLWNYSDKQAFGEPREIQRILKLDGTLFSSGAMSQDIYLIDSQHSNIMTNQTTPNLKMSGSKSLVGKAIVEETISLENGGVMYFEVNHKLPAPTSLRITD